ncbi:MAG TPA: N-acetyl sugar amidotransferase [Mesorhizobium sp.]|jgi:N-acetyl sugar amidotransferase|uniref:N-acetyl sugar amidotransferase n=1 Tax=Mesorhizobium sp. TaxID=1871066 RepID=UPI002DDCB190|nr:N-acetyl sugar amidotransferase [Mesorhizobium sp.]HEV2503135.1 N-acetyl sugar amidotransferase [Mesorhizobium sp.]
MTLLQKCGSCLLPETYETIEFDQKGVCNVCRGKEVRDEKIDWATRKTKLDELIERHRGQHDYDCIIPFSGGKDSTYTLLYLMKEYKLKPLVVRFDHGFMRETLVENNTRTFKKLGVDVLNFTPNWRVVKRLMLESLRRKGDFCWHCHTGIFSYPMHMAVKFNVPLVFWGEPSSEYTAYYDYAEDEIEQVDETRFNRFVNLGITAEDMYGMIKDDFDLDPRDLLPYTYPKMRDLKRLRYESVCLGSYIPWDVKKNVEVIQRELGWKGDQVEGMPWEEYPYEKIECFMQGMRDYIKYLKRGYSRVSQMVALDLRNGRISKEHGQELVDKYEGRKPPSLDIFLDYVGLDENEFNEIVSHTIVPPNEPDFGKNEWAPKTWDYERWYREGEGTKGIQTKR